MQEDFIDWPDYGVCPKCKKKVELPEVGKKTITDTELTPVLKRLPRKEKRLVMTYKCPHCGEEMKYINGQSRLDFDGEKVLP
jgi:DNA-directed RNA polymerase subunit RPC12/RpoP